MKMRKERCKYPDCNRVRCSPDGYCDTCVNPMNRHHCECGAEIGRRSKRCRPCSTAINASAKSIAMTGKTLADRNAEPFCKPITDEGMAMLRQGRVSYESLNPDQQYFRRVIAQSTVECGLLTQDQSEQEYRSAWTAIERGVGANCMEVE